MKSENRKFEGLGRLIAFFAERRTKLLPILFNKKKVRLGIALGTIAQYHFHMAMLEFFHSNNSIAARQHMYTATRLNIFALDKDGGSMSGSSLNYLVALLSDNREVARDLAKRTSQIDDEEDDFGDPYIKLELIRLAIAGDDVELERLNNKFSSANHLAESDDYFQLLLSENVQALEELIAKMAEKRGGSGLPEDEFFPYEATMAAKICWYRGLPVRVPPTKIPSSWMEFHPLENYAVEYDFLEPGWIPPKVGILSAMRGWFRA